jgi:hypothetical protein
VKLPFLVEHFIEHKEQNQQLTLWQFLCIHYSQDDNEKSDNEKDMKLPFKSHDNCNGTNIIAFVCNPFAEFQLANRIVYVESEPFLFNQEDPFSTSFLSNIWQPPRVC